MQPLSFEKRENQAAPVTQTLADRTPKRPSRVTGGTSEAGALGARLARASWPNSTSRSRYEGDRRKNGRRAVPSRAGDGRRRGLWQRRSCTFLGWRAPL